MQNPEKSEWIKFIRQLSGKSQRKVYVVNGAPGSGKTTYVQSHRHDDDLVLDLDYICAALNANDKLYGDHSHLLDTALKVKALILNEIRNQSGAWNTAFVITAESDKAKVNKLARELNAELITMHTDLGTCVKQLKSDPRRADQAEKFISLAEEWYKENQDAEGGELNAPLHNHI